MLVKVFCDFVANMVRSKIVIFTLDVLLRLPVAYSASSSLYAVADVEKFKLDSVQ